MHRTQILLEDWQYEHLLGLAKRNEKSMGELIRAWISEKLRPAGSAPSAQDPLLQSIGMIPKKRKSECSESPVSPRIDTILYRKDW